MTKHAIIPRWRVPAGFRPTCTSATLGRITIALAVEKAFKQGKVPQAARDSYLSELIGWRELAVNFVKFTENYDSFDCAEPGRTRP